MKGKSRSAYVSMAGGLLSLVTLVVYVIYGCMYDYFDGVVALSLVLGAACAAGYSMIDKKITEFLNLLQVIVVAYGVGLFFLNSYPVWADRVNGIDMYGSRGTLVPVVIIIILFLISDIAGIISCFMRKKVDD